MIFKALFLFMCLLTLGNFYSQLAWHFRKIPMRRAK